jgi:polygalacturonase
MNRRRLIGMMGLAAAAGAVAGPATTAPNPNKRAGLFDIRDYGATGDGLTLDSPSINRAIDACHDIGGGVVYAPPGVYLSGTIILKSNVTLYLEAGATVLGSKNISDYGSAKGPHAHSDANQKHLIFARDAENIGLAGPGRLDGQGPAFWVPSGRTVPPASEHWRDVVAYDWKPLSRPSPMLEFYNCRHVRVEDVRIENAPGWTLRPIQCEHVVIRGIAIKNPVIGPNTDGIDLTCSREVFISDCLIDTGDDAICLKSESPYGGEPHVSRNITVTNCVLTCCCNGFKFGTGTAGGFENIVFSNSVIFNEDVDPNARVIAGIALEMVDGGWIDGVMISNIRMQRVRTPIFIRRGARHPAPDGAPGGLRGVMIDNVHATGALLASSITGLPGFPVEDVTLSNIRIDSTETGRAEWMQRAVPEAAHSYPEARMFGRLPVHGLYCRHVNGLRLRNIEFKAPTAEERPAVQCEDTQDVDIDSLRSTPPSGTQSTLKLVQNKDVCVRGSTASPSAGAFVEITGEKTQRVAIINNNLSAAAAAAHIDPSVPKDATIISNNLRD